MNDNSTMTNGQRVLAYIHKVSWMAILAVIAWLAKSGNDGGFLKDIWEQAKVASPFAAMLALLLYFDERRERREAQRQCNTRTIEFIEANNAAHAALDKMASATQQKRRGT